jgi:hypothetical protein
LNERANDHCHVTPRPLSLLAVIAAAESKSACPKTSRLLPRQNDEHEHLCFGDRAVARAFINASKLPDFQAQYFVSDYG